MKIIDKNEVNKLCSNLILTPNIKHAGIKLKKNNINPLIKVRNHQM